jgi:hypothetical protein
MNLLDEGVENGNLLLIEMMNFIIWEYYILVCLESTPVLVGLPRAHEHVYPAVSFSIVCIPYLTDFINRTAAHQQAKKNAAGAIALDTRCCQEAQPNSLIDLGLCSSGVLGREPRLVL